MKVLVTGASGFIGRGLVPKLLTSGHEVVLAVRQPVKEFSQCRQVLIEDLNESTDWTEALDGCQGVIHAAAHAATADLSEQADIDRLYQVNTHATVGLAKQAASMGVARMVFVSSIKVNGETSQPGKAMTADDVPAPAGQYGESKLKAEAGIAKVSASTALESVVVRPPLVYGPGVQANFKLLMKLVAKGVPLPFGSARNRRSFVARDNLVDFLETCLTHKDAANGLFLVSDDDDLPMNEWFKSIGNSLGKPARLMPFPTGLIATGCRALGKASLANSILGSLELDIEFSKQTLNWKPPVSVKTALEQTAAEFQASSNT